MNSELLWGPVSSDVAVLNVLHAERGWVPCEQHVRPGEEKRKEKEQLLANAALRYDCHRSYVLHKVFRMPAEFSGSFENSRLSVSMSSLLSHRAREERVVVFVENLFGYDVPEECVHFVLWYLLREGETHVHVKDDEITKHIESRFDREMFDDFCWYRNPKPSLMDDVTGHVQVFLKKKN